MIKCPDERMNQRTLCISLLGHVDAGKTTLSESLLYKCREIKKAGRVDDKDCFLDTDTYERERGITIYSKIARFSTDKMKFVLVDTPGHLDFSLETQRALSVLDMAVLLISANEGVTPHTKNLWRLLKFHRIPTVIFINKTDISNRDIDDIIAELKKELSADVTDFTDDEDAFFYENAASASERLMEMYFEEGRIPKEAIKEAVGERLIFPCLYGSALKFVTGDESGRFGEGIHRLLSVLEDYAPNKTYPDEFAAFVYKITRNETGVRLTHMKILGGTLRVKDMLNSEKANELRLYSGARFERVSCAEAGDIVTVVGLNESGQGMVYGHADINSTGIFEPVLSYAVNFSDGVDVIKMLEIMRTLEEEEPGLLVEYDERTREIRVSLMGEIQAQILQNVIKDRFGADVSFGSGRIAYKETITDIVEGVGHFEPLRHYAEVHLKLEPLERGSGLVFENIADADELGISWQKLIMTHLKERNHRGVLTGSPITDMKITLLSGKAHIKHTEGGDFRQATYRAVRQGLMQASSTLLEPFYDFTLEIPSAQIGRAMMDLERMCCVCEVTENCNDTAILTGRGPVATLNGYAKDVPAFTHGRGSIHFAPSGYDRCHNPEEVIESMEYNPQADIRNTPDSVFCAHGAGVTVSWNEVFNYMHLPLTIYDDCVKDTNESLVINHGTSGEKEIFVTTEEIDELINKTAYANRKNTQVSYKGISAAMRTRQRESNPGQITETKYKGTQTKPSIMLIDGYNVVHAWPELADLAKDNINGAAGRLMDIVSDYAGACGTEILLVFDAYKVPGHKTEEQIYGNITVIYTKTAETADHYIERYAHENNKKYEITVVTSDGVEQIIIRGAGSYLMSSRDFYSETKRARSAIAKYISE